MKTPGSGLRRRDVVCLPRREHTSGAALVPHSYKKYLGDKTTDIALEDQLEAYGFSGP